MQVALPEMRRRGYSDALIAGSIAGGGTLGSLIPPSVIMVVYAILTQQSVLDLFRAAIVPGIVAVLLVQQPDIGQTVLFSAVWLVQAVLAGLSVADVFLHGHIGKQCVILKHEADVALLWREVDAPL